MSETQPQASQQKRGRGWLRVLLVVFVLAVLGGLILPYFLDVDRYRTLLASVIENETGRKVTIGRIRARLLPSVGFVVEDFRLGNPLGFPEGSMLSVEAIRGKLALRPLFRREFQLNAVELVRPRLMLLEDDSGRTNYSRESGPDASRKRTGLRPRSAGRQTLAEKPDTTIFGKPARFAEVERVELSDAEVTLGRLEGRERRLAPSLRAQKISGELSHVALDAFQPRQWRGEASLGGVQVELPGWKEPVVFRSGRLSLREGRIESEFRAELGKAGEAKGRLHVADIERGVVSFELSMPQLDLGQLLAWREETPAAPSRARPGHGELVAQGKLEVEHVRWQPYAGSNASAEIRVFTDRVELWPVSAEFCGGTLQVSARSDRTQAPRRFSANVQVRNLDVGKLLANSSPSVRGKMSGRGELDLQLFGSLAPDWVKSLSGTGQFAVRDGRLPGINLAGALESLAKVVGVGGETPFTLIQGDLSISQGRVASRVIHMDSPHGTMDLQGSTGLDGSLNYDGQIVLVPGAGGPAGGATTPAEAIAGILGGVLKRNVARVTVPLAIRGNFSDLHILPGRGRPTIESPTPAPPATPGQQPPKKSILDLFRRP